MSDDTQNMDGFSPQGNRDKRGPGRPPKDPFKDQASRLADLPDFQSVEPKFFPSSAGGLPRIESNAIPGYHIAWIPRLVPGGPHDAGSVDAYYTMGYRPVVAGDLPDHYGRFATQDSGPDGPIVYRDVILAKIPIRDYWAIQKGNQMRADQAAAGYQLSKEDGGWELQRNLGGVKAAPKGWDA